MQEFRKRNNRYGKQFTKGTEQLHYKIKTHESNMKMFSAIVVVVNIVGI